MSDGRNGTGSFLNAIERTFSTLVATADEDLYAILTRSLVPFGYKVNWARDGKEALDIARNGGADIIVAEPGLGILNGFELCRALKQHRKARRIPYLLIVPYFDVDQKIKALQNGVDDFLYWPIHQAELRARIRSLLRVKDFYTRLEHQRDHLDQLVQQRTRELDELTIGLVTALEKAASFNDEDTGGHIKRVCHYSQILAKAIGVSDSLRNKIRRYASLHDVGKVGLPDRILKKRGKLSPSEREEMKRHTTLGAELLEAAKVEGVARNIALCHHEKYDGTGYPRGLRAEEIPIEGRVVALADVFDALTTRRCYKEAMELEDATAIIERESGKSFDPGLVQSFRAQEAAFRRVYLTHRDRLMPSLFPDAPVAPTEPNAAGAQTNDPPDPW